MFSQPKITQRNAQYYAGIRVDVTMQEMGTGLIPTLHGEVFAWLRQRGIPPHGAPFLRLVVVNMEEKLTIELGVPVESEIVGDGRVNAGTLPAGRYASLIYTGIANDIEGNRILLEWAQNQGLALDWWKVPAGDAFASRFESYITEPDDEPDPAKWDTEVCIKLAD